MFKDQIYLEIAAIAVEYDLRMVILFGSAARKGIELANDLDLAVSGSPELYSSENFFRLRDKLETCFAFIEKPIDIVPIRTDDPVLLAQIADDGIPLFERDPDAFSRFKLFARFYIDDHAQLLNKKANNLRKELASL